MVQGPWEARWNIPGTDPANAAIPLRFTPQSSAHSADSVYPVAEEVFLSDRDPAGNC